jgi:acetyltransferase-like isoleucine patch superfamily enzyme
MLTLRKKKRIPFKQILLTGFLPSFIKVFIYRLKGYKIGKKVSIGFGSVISGRKVEIKDHAKIGFLTIIRGQEIKIGRFVSIGSTSFIDVNKFHVDDDSRIKEQVYVGGLFAPDSELIIGKRAIIMQFSFINPTKPIKIGDDTGIGGHCLLFTHGSWLSQLDGFPVTFAPITLGNNVWLPWRVFIMPGVRVGDNVVIGANSLVTMDIPSNCLAAGSPAKILKENYPPPLSDEKKAEILEEIFASFLKHLEYHSFQVNKYNHRTGFKIEVKKKKNCHTLIYVNKGNPCISVTNKKNVLVLDCMDLRLDGFKESAFQMIIDLRRKERIGTSEIGEEFAKYLSRHGIRFNRLD